MYYYWKNPSTDLDIAATVGPRDLSAQTDQTHETMKRKP
jgi:hypothetical protein